MQDPKQYKKEFENYFFCDECAKEKEKWLDMYEEYIVSSMDGMDIQADADKSLQKYKQLGIIDENYILNLDKTLEMDLPVFTQEMFVIHPTKEGVFVISEESMWDRDTCPECNSKSFLFVK